jgi:hypothetical protein
MVEFLLGSANTKFDQPPDTNVLSRVKSGLISLPVV